MSATENMSRVESWLRQRFNRWLPQPLDMIAMFAALPVIPIPLRNQLLSLRGHQFGWHSRLRAGTVVTGKKLVVGREVIINRECLIDTTATVAIGDRTGLACRVTIATGSHHIGEADRRMGPLYSAPVSIGEGCWIGAGALILPGVTIADGSVVAAGSVVTKDVGSNLIVGGNPAKVIRPL